MQALERALSQAQAIPLEPRRDAFFAFPFFFYSHKIILTKYELTMFDIPLDNEQHLSYNHNLMHNSQ